MDNNIIVGTQIIKHRKIYIGLMSLIALLEVAMLIRGIIAFSFSSYRHYLYTASYIFLMLASASMVIFLLLTRTKEVNMKLYILIAYGYSIAILLWSLLISFLDMERSSMPIVYLTVIVTIAGVVVLEPKYFVSMILISYFLLVGLDSIGGFNYFVSLSEYINFSIFVIMAMLISVKLYYISLRDYMQKEKLESSVKEERNRVSAISLQTILSISNAVDAKDKYTKEHSQRVAEYAQIIARNLHWSEEKIKQIYQIGLLHDIGKIGVPDAILNSTSKLTKEEFDLMKQHTVIGGEILKDLTILENVDLGAKYHHERFDGTGYPSGLKGLDIPLEARVIAVADAFDAMNSNRVYRGRLTKEKIISELTEGKGKQFDPDIIDSFMPSALEILNKE